MKQNLDGLQSYNEVNEMKKYKVSWNESITCYVEVEAKDKEEAKNKAINTSYKDIEPDLIQAENFEIKEVKG